jgi:3alpha(or 20beta)-hydroxysteroid dehydrogenase
MTTHVDGKCRQAHAGSGFRYENAGWRKNAGDLMGRLDGKVALITGAARSMGAATARLFAAQGAKIVVADVLEEEGRALQADIGASALFQRLDVSDEKNWHRVRDAVSKEFGTVDILINNAGILKFGALLDFDVADFERVLKVNLIGCFLGMKTIVPAMIAKGAGAIVNISSIDGMKGANCIGAYAASKWGVRGLTKVAALEFGHLGVRVNSVHPGGIDTPMGNPRGLGANEVNKDYTNVPLQRIGRTDEVARASLFLASDEASYVNGAELAVDGGWTAGHYYHGYPGAPGVGRET